MDNHQFTLEEAQEFHRRMAAIIAAVQAGIWEAGQHNLLGYATDYAFGQERGLQTLILPRSRSPALNSLTVSTKDNFRLDAVGPRVATPCLPNGPELWRNRSLTK
jgi:hypothetical protein